MSRPEHFRHILDAIDIGLDGADPEVHHERPMMFEEMLPETVRSIAVFPDGSTYSITIEAVSS